MTFARSAAVFSICAMAFPVAAGAHELMLKRAGKGSVEFERFVITNDLGWEPDGTTSFLIKQQKQQ